MSKKSDEIRKGSSHMLNNVNDMVRMMLPMMRMKYSELPNFAEEYKIKFPNETRQIELLELEECKQKQTIFQEKNNLVFDGEDENESKNYNIRWGAAARDKKLESFLNRNPKSGTIFEYNPSPYGANMSEKGEGSIKNLKVFYQTMRNFVCSDVVYVFGHRYVSFGFVDLLQLMLGKHVNADDISAKLHYFCYDKCPIIVARAHVIWKLLNMQHIRLQSVIQIWFSTCWDTQALEDFRKACSLVVVELTNDQVCKHESTLKFIKHWINALCKPEDATKKWLEPKDGTDFEALNCISKREDRLQYARYVLTGVLLVEESKVVSGNVSMFATPDDGKEYVFRSQNIFNCIDFYSNAAKLFNIKYLENPHKESSYSLIGFVERLLIEKLDNLICLVRNGQIEAFFEQKDILPNDNTFASTIKAKDPCGIEWSNIPDYMEKKKFIDLAQKCSGKKTVHFIDCMNWPKKVFGACWFDYMKDKSFLKKSYYEMKSACVKNWRNFDWKNEAYPIPKFLNLNFVGYSLNVYDQVLAVKYVDEYIKYFFTDTDGTQMNRHLNKDEIMKFNPFSRTSNSFHIAVSFNKKIRLSPVLK